MKLTKYVITKFEPKEAEEERIAASRLNGGDFIIKKAREPSEFEGKTIAITTSGILFDREELIALIMSAKETADLARKNSNSSPELAAHRGASYAFESLIKELQL